MRYLMVFVTVIWVGCLSVVAQKNFSKEAGVALFSGITPDARAAGMGEAGITTTADVFSVYHNTAKVMFARERTQVALGYVPWMSHVSGDMNLSVLAFYHQLDKHQALSGGFRYFSTGKIALTDESGASLGDIRPGEFAIDLGYSRLLAKYFSAALTLHYIHSDPGKGVEGFEAGNTATVDLGLFYVKPLSWLNGKAVWSWGLQLANAGPKLSYGEESFFLPCKLGLGTSVCLPFSDKHELNCVLDLNRRMLPATGFGTEDLMWSGGLEYWYIRMLALRVGYYNAGEEAGNHKLFTFGCGVRWNCLMADVAYAVPSDDTDALKNTIRFSIGIDLGVLKNR